MKGIAVIITGDGETVAHSEGCLEFHSQAQTAQGPAGVFSSQEALLRALNALSREEFNEELAALQLCDCLGKDMDGNLRRSAEERAGRTGGSGADGARSARDAGSADSNGSEGRSRSASMDQAGARGNSTAPKHSRLSKPEAFAQDAKEAGWDPEISRDGDLATVVAWRGDDESIKITWMGEACRDGSLYQLGSYQRTLRNAAACRRQLLVPRETAAEIVAGRKAKRVGKKVVAAPAKRMEDPQSTDYEEDEEPRYQGYVPFDAEDPAEDILRAVIGKQVTWKSSINRSIYSARVMANPDQRQLRIERHPRTGRRTLTFAAEDQGFRSVYLTSIIDVQ